MLAICWHDADVLGCRAVLRNRPQRLASSWGQNQASTEGQKVQPYSDSDSGNLLLVLGYRHSVVNGARSRQAPQVQEASRCTHRLTSPLPEVALVLAAVGIAVCVGVVVVVWVAGALYNAFRSPHSASHVPRERTRSQPGSAALIVVAAVCAGLVIVSRSHFDGLVVGALWVRVLGLAVLVVSTVFTLRARFSLGTMWSLAPKVKGDHHLRTHGPYAVTRHPIYTGVSGCCSGPRC